LLGIDRIFNWVYTIGVVKILRKGGRLLWKIFVRMVMVNEKENSVVNVAQSSLSPNRNQIEILVNVILSLILNHVLVAVSNYKMAIRSFVRVADINLTGGVCKSPLAVICVRYYRLFYFLKTKTSARAEDFVFKSYTI
jgi:hypothetical protein